MSSNQQPARSNPASDTCLPSNPAHSPAQVKCYFLTFAAVSFDLIFAAVSFDHYSKHVIYTSFYSSPCHLISSQLPPKMLWRERVTMRWEPFVKHRKYLLVFLWHVSYKCLQSSNVCETQFSVGCWFSLKYLHSSNVNTSGKVTCTGANSVNLAQEEIC